MEDPLLVALGVAVGVALLVLGGRIRRRSLPPRDRRRR
jgi:hypothetical protein